jgi:hypothetical protein
MYLVTETEKLDGGTRWMQISFYLTPWFVPLIFGMLLCYVLKLDEGGVKILLLPFLITSVGGIFYVCWVFLFYGTRADIRRKMEARAAVAKSGEPPYAGPWGGI